MFNKLYHKSEFCFCQIKRLLSGISFRTCILFSVFLLLLCKAAVSRDAASSDEIIPVSDQMKLQPISMDCVKISNTSFSSDPLVKVQVSTVSGSILHSDIQFDSNSSVQIVSKAGTETVAPDSTMDIRTYFKEKSISSCVLTPFSNSGQSDGIRIMSIQRGRENPIYPGELEIRYEKESDAFWIVNTVPLELYLPGVVASEMPSSFGLEALKAQAVCARSYAAASLNSGSEVLSDTTADQVYRPCHMDDIVRTACEETRGEILTDENGTILKPHYYSTGWGSRADSGVFSKGKLTESDHAAAVPALADNTIFSAVFPLDEQNSITIPDAESPWHMWRCELPADSRLMQEKFEKEVQDIYVTERADSGYVTKIQVCFRDGTCADLNGASSIRSLLGSKDTVYTLSNGESRSNVRLLPSPYFTIQKEESLQNNTQDHAGSSEKTPVFQIIGSGFGHGCGMSQYGASGLAAMGYDYKSILAYYFG